MEKNKPNKNQENIIDGHGDRVNEKAFFVLKNGGPLQLVVSEQEFKCFNRINHPAR